MNEYRVTQIQPSISRPVRCFTPRKNGPYSSKSDKHFLAYSSCPTEYQRVEDAYVEVALSFLRESGLPSMKVAGLENRMEPLDFQNDTVLPFDRIGEIIRRILREEFWCRLEGSEGFIHFGWDYYMYVGMPLPCPKAQARAAELGLYVEEFASPIRESLGEAEAESR